MEQNKDQRDDDRIEGSEEELTDEDLQDVTGGGGQGWGQGGSKDHTGPTGVPTPA